jgi:hypothetical protein
MAFRLSVSCGSKYKRPSFVLYIKEITLNSQTTRRTRSLDATHRFQRFPRRGTATGRWVGSPLYRSTPGTQTGRGGWHPRDRPLCTRLHASGTFAGAPCLLPKLLAFDDKYDCDLHLIFLKKRYLLCKKITQNTYIKNILKKYKAISIACRLKLYKTIFC